MKFILEDLDLENFLIPIKTKWDHWSEAPKYCFKDFAEFKIYINILEDSKLIEEYMFVNKECEEYQNDRRYWDYATKKLIEKDKTGKWIYKAGKNWLQDKVNYKKLIDVLIKKDKTGEWVYFAGIYWPYDKIDYKKLINALIQKDKTGEWIYKTGIYWPYDKADYNKLSIALCKVNNKNYVRQAKEDWPVFYDCETSRRMK